MGDQDIPEVQRRPRGGVQSKHVSGPTCRPVARAWAGGWERASSQGHVAVGSGCPGPGLGVQGPGRCNVLSAGIGQGQAGVPDGSPSCGALDGPCSPQAGQRQLDMHQPGAHVTQRLSTGALMGMWFQEWDAAWPTWASSQQNEGLVTRTQRPRENLVLLMENKVSKWFLDIYHRLSSKLYETRRM